MNLRSLFYFIFILCFTSACNHLDQSCLEINWYELGRQDSTRGLNQSDSFAERQKICSIEPDSIQAKAYDNGFSAGLISYCNFKTGYIYSLSQMKKEVSTCPEELKMEFVKGYEIGTYMKKIQTLQKEIQNKIQYLNKKLENHNSHISLAE
ncbi:MAG: DUF2799 domain-containing protein [Bdellovibrionaceae bacterium]|nr:DUF2799 domain-containing protein [Pseudobdellovibrionaceae bacterium]